DHDERVAAERHMLAERICAGPGASREILADDRDAGPSRSVVGGEVAPDDQGDAHGAEVSGPNDVRVEAAAGQRCRLIGLAWIQLDVRSRATIAEWHDVRDAHRCHARKRRDLASERRQERVRSLWRVALQAEVE